VQEFNIISIYIIRPKRSIALGKSRKYSTRQNNGVYAFNYNYAESEQIWMKSMEHCEHIVGLALIDFGRYPRSSDSLRGSRKRFLVR